MSVEKRTFNTPSRERWNPVIYQCLKAIDCHMEFYLKTRDEWHMEKAAFFREYLHELKTWILTEEAKATSIRNTF